MSLNQALKHLGFRPGHDYLIEMAYPETPEGRPPPEGVPVLRWLSAEPQPADAALVTAADAARAAAPKRAREREVAAQLAAPEALAALFEQVQALATAARAVTPAMQALADKIAKA